MLEKLKDYSYYGLSVIITIAIMIPVMIVFGSYLLYLRLFHRKVYDAWMEEEADLFDVW